MSHSPAPLSLLAATLTAFHAYLSEANFQGVGKPKSARPARPTLAEKNWVNFSQAIFFAYIVSVINAIPAPKFNFERSRRDGEPLPPRAGQPDMSNPSASGAEDDNPRFQPWVK